MFTNKNYILKIYEEGSFSKAAESLYISQPSLSATVKRLEEKIGVPLFDRSTFPVSLTEVGREYVKYAMEIEEKENDFSRFLSDFTNSLTGTVQIGGSSLFSAFVLPAMISEFNKQYPKVSFKIFENNTHSLVENLNLGQLDIIIDNTVIKSNEITSYICASEMILLAVPKSFGISATLQKFCLNADDIKNNKHLSDKYSVDINMFSAYPFILLNPENDTGKRANMLFSRHHIKPNILFSLDQQVTSYNISCTGMGISFVSDILIKNIDSSPDLNYFRLADSNMTRNIFFYRKKTRYISEPCQRFIDANINIQQ